MLDPVLIVGSYLSPYVRKVLVCLETKGVAYEIDPIVPFLGDERFSKLSPLRRVPVYRDERVTFADSSVICQYPEDRHSDPPLYPAFVRFRIDTARWPKTAELVERALASEGFRRLARFEDLMLRTPIHGQRAALAESGAPLTRETFGTSTPRRGVLSV
jgi:glutathione S-transferase